jgi:alpha-beta hydrolase superfamily lysophospholipase
MIYEPFTFTAQDGLEIFVHKWLPEGKIIGTVQIAHGVGEHSGRYDYFAKKLVEQGYAVFGNDHRGHGRTAKTLENLVYLGDNGWNSMIRDTYLLTCIIKEHFPDVPAFFFGHSMGSFILRQYLYEYPNRLNGAILAGTGFCEKILLNAGLLIAKRFIEKNGAKKRSYYLNKMVFENFNDKISNPASMFDWISRDTNIVKQFLSDPSCGIPCTNNFFYELLKGLKELQRTKNVSKTPKNTSILLVSGDKDPVGHWGKDVLALAKHYKKLGIKDVKCRLFKDGRHEVINEINRDEVINYVITWMNIHISRYQD